ncbi:hypothetical protein E3T35_14590 [Cryobacterium sp. TMT1-2-2]|uniref:hypothetical protein n=1 Tax=Cryobacterium sp. TMT1-2-2 TaxID=1259233 RepID=UPI001069B22D|nr:hypothetical protein [Cryobacterium sp. TMT1-2-2]TFD09699.1 hypothetical protein E3T35_14590 [Cryobacterium sp. TMT1-2-2]
MGEEQAGQGASSRSGLARLVSVSMVVLGAMAVVIGLVLLVLPSGQASFGWFAHAPLSDTTFFPPSGLLSPRNQLGIGVFTIGLAVLAFGAGWMLGSRLERARWLSRNYFRMSTRR